MGNMSKICNRYRLICNRPLGISINPKEPAVYTRIPTHRRVGILRRIGPYKNGGCTQNEKHIFEITRIKTRFLSRSEFESSGSIEGNNGNKNVTGTTAVTNFSALPDRNNCRVRATGLGNPRTGVAERDSPKDLPPPLLCD